VAAGRRHEVTRLEAFSDAVFAFALTLLVVSLEAPRSYHELMALARGFLPFACSFALLVWIWYEHSAFFSRYHLDDPLTAALNAALLFVVLFYVYPLKYITTVMFHQLLPELHLEPPANAVEVSRLFILYGAGYISVFAILAGLYYRAWRKRHDLALTPIEAFDARLYAGRHALSAMVGLLSIGWALVAPGKWAAFAGFVYFLMAPVQTIYGAWGGRRRRVRFEHAARPRTKA
jgi:hypothetical protein